MRPPRPALPLAIVALAATAAPPLVFAGEAPRLGAPIQVKDGDRAIDVEIGHAAPLLEDWDGDGKPDLLVGQFGNGKLRLYRNAGTAAEPRFKGFEWVQAGGGDAKIPAG